MTQKKLSMKQRQTRRQSEHTCDSRGGWAGQQGTGRLGLAETGYHMQSGETRSDFSTEK